MNVFAHLNFIVTVTYVHTPYLIEATIQQVFQNCLSHPEDKPGLTKLSSIPMYICILLRTMNFSYSAILHQYYTCVNRVLVL